MAVTLSGGKAGAYVDAKTIANADLDATCMVGLGKNRTGILISGTEAITFHFPSGDVVITPTTASTIFPFKCLGVSTSGSSTATVLY
jgi:hypothetical protein